MIQQGLACLQKQAMKRQSIAADRDKDNACVEKSSMHLSRNYRIFHQTAKKA